MLRRSHRPTSTSDPTSEAKTSRLVETPSGGGAVERHEGVSLEVGSEAYHEALHEKLQGVEADRGVRDVLPHLAAGVATDLERL